VIELDLQARKNIRLQGYDYAQNGAYFITVCVKDKLNLLWDNGNLIIVDEQKADQFPCRGEHCSPESKAIQTIHPQNPHCSLAINQPLTINGLDNDDDRRYVTPTEPDEPVKISFVGKIIDNAINNVPAIYENVKIDKYTIMPNHIHMIMVIDNTYGFSGVGEQHTEEQNMEEQNGNEYYAGEQCSPLQDTDTPTQIGIRTEPPIPVTISRIIKQFKGSVTKQTGYTIWQKSFHDHIIRNEKEYLDIWQYIDENPMKWQNDCYYE
jgi:REP element-mobilizing transposase RayT